ncbi:hypothetical protein J5N97_015881 [Dioscorea zingiberensis]|uniref:Uncharacterized protein n=1 Tax=Dioscorea zingiberensis TaxID=325984 RepID=A0A9D5CIM3_9LILI|nr:hypothetical protein J5N97_015881 [Dioscorea zingiberensis]
MMSPGMTTCGNVSVPEDGLLSARDLTLPPQLPQTIYNLLKTLRGHSLSSRQGYHSNDLEFYIDLWSEEQLLFSRGNLRMVMHVDPRFTIPLGRTVTVSILIGRKDTNEVACIVNRSVFDYVDGSAFRALAYDYLKFSPGHPFISGIRAWVSLLFMGNSNENIIDVFGIEIDFCDAASSETEVLWLLDMLDWK